MMSPTVFVRASLTAHTGRALLSRVDVLRDTRDAALGLTADLVDPAHGVWAADLYIGDGRSAPVQERCVSGGELAALIDEWTSGAVLVGVAPDLEVDHLAALMRWYGIEPTWAADGPVDLVVFARGWLTAMARLFCWPLPDPLAVDALCRLCGVPPLPERERLAPLGMLRWAARWWDRLQTWQLPQLTETTADIGMWREVAA